MDIFISGVVQQYMYTKKNVKCMQKLPAKKLILDHIFQNKCTSGRVNNQKWHSSRSKAPRSGETDIEFECLPG